MIRASGPGSMLSLLLAGFTTQAGVAEIKALYENVNELIGKKATRDVSLYAADRQDHLEWVAVSGRADQEEFDRSDFRARAYLRDARVLKARIETTSASGDWSLTEDYYFHGNGRTAFYFRSLVTFQGYDYEHDRPLPEGPYIVEERRYYDEAGRKIRRLEKAFIEKTRQDVPARYIRANLPAEFFPDVKSLPFHAALSRVIREHREAGPPAPATSPAP